MSCACVPLLTRAGRQGQRRDGGAGDAERAELLSHPVAACLVDLMVALKAAVADAAELRVELKALKQQRAEELGRFFADKRQGHLIALMIAGSRCGSPRADAGRA